MINCTCIASAASGMYHLREYNNNSNNYNRRLERRNGNDAVKLRRNKEAVCIFDVTKKNAILFENCCSI